MNNQQQDPPATTLASPPEQTPGDPLSAAPGEHESNRSVAREIGDLFIGLFGSLAVCIALIFSTTLPTPGLLSPIMITLVYILQVVAAVYAFKRRRRYIGIGLTVALCLQLLIGGGCMLMFATGVIRL